jgi:hypothetical protein
MMRYVYDFQDKMTTDYENASLSRRFITRECWNVIDASKASSV